MNNIELAKELSEKKIVIRGKRLRLRWLDKYILIWSKEDYPFDD